MLKPVQWIPAGVLLLGCAGLLRTTTQTRMQPDAPMNTILPEVDGFRVTDQKVSDEERSVAGMTDYVARVYWRDTVPAFTTLVSYYDSQTQGKTIHSPRNCLPGAGWEILTAGTAVIDAGGREYMVNRNALKNGAFTAIVYYWYQGRGRVEANEYKVKWNLLRDAALAGHTEEALVRVVVPVEQEKDDKAAAQALARADSLGSAISARLIFDVERALPKRNVGPRVAVHRR